MRLLLLGFALTLALTGCTKKDEAAVAPTAANTTPKQATGDIRAGLTIAERDCKSCHGLDGVGTAPAIPHLAAQRANYMLEAIKEYKAGKRVHAALEMTGKLSESDMLNVVSYYSSLPAVTVAADKAASRFLPYEHGKAKSAACAKCHSDDGNSKTPGIPNLAGQQPRYFVVALQEYLHGARKKDPMHALLPLLNKLDMESLALYFASQTPAPRTAPPSGDPVAGERLSTVCAGCHGPAGLSTDASTSTLASQDFQYLVNAIKSYKKGRQHEGMRALVSKLSDKDIDNIAAFYTTQKSRPAANGEALVKDLVEKCDRCHKAGLENPTMAVPTINGQDKDYLVMSLRSYRDTRRESSLMHNMSLPYSDAIIEGIASFYASQPPK